MMFGSETIRILFLVTYALVAFSVLTGLFKFAFKENEVLNLLHKMSGPAINVLFLIFFVLSMISLGQMRIIPRSIIIVLFVTLTYAGAVTAYHRDKSWIMLIHRILGIISFVLFTMLLIVFLIM